MRKGEVIGGVVGGIAVMGLMVLLVAIALLLGPIILYLLWHWLVPYFFPELDVRYAMPPFWHVAGVYYLLAVIGGLFTRTTTKSKDD